MAHPAGAAMFAANTRFGPAADPIAAALGVARAAADAAVANDHDVDSPGTVQSADEESQEGES